MADLRKFMMIKDIPSKNRQKLMRNLRVSKLTSKSFALIIIIYYISFVSTFPFARHTKFVYKHALQCFGCVFISGDRSVGEDLAVSSRWYRG
jgi:hypothetical protein